WDSSYLWLLRRVALGVRGFPAHRERVSLRTYCSATGPRWAERTTTVSGTDGDLIQSTAIWVAVSANGRPVPLGESFQRVYGPSAGGRQVSARLTHPGLPGSAGGGPGRRSPRGGRSRRFYGPSAGGRQSWARLPPPGLPGSPGGGPGRCAPRTSTPPATSTTPFTGLPSRTSWAAWTGCPAGPS